MKHDDDRWKSLGQGKITQKIQTQGWTNLKEDLNGLESVKLLKTCWLNSFSKFIFVVCNVWFNARQTNLLAAKFWFCFLNAEFRSGIRALNGHNWILKSELESRDTAMLHKKTQILKTWPAHHHWFLKHWKTFTSRCYTSFPVIAHIFFSSNWSVYFLRFNNYVQAKQGVSPLMGKIPWLFYDKQLNTKFPLEIICTKKDTVWSMTF